MLVFLPYIKIPTLYILPASQTKNIEEVAKTSMETATSQSGGENASLAGMTMGENSGKMEDHVAKLEVGDSMATIMI